jgi:hypothetical protein
MARFGNPCLKQQTVSEFPVAERGSVAYVHKWLKYVYSVNVIDKNTAAIGFHMLHGLR